jgi:hypothetical protein
LLTSSGYLEIKQDLCHVATANGFGLNHEGIAVFAVGPEGRDKNYRPIEQESVLQNENFSSLEIQLPMS